MYFAKDAVPVVRRCFADLEEKSQRSTTLKLEWAAI
jgi:hypothetical protein